MLYCAGEAMLVTDKLLLNWNVLLSDIKKTMISRSSEAIILKETLPKQQQLQTVTLRTHTHTCP